MVSIRNSEPNVSGGAQAIAVSKIDGGEIATLFNWDEIYKFKRAHRGDDSIRIEYIQDSPAYDSDYKAFAVCNISPGLAITKEEHDRRFHELDPYFDYGNSVRAMLCEYTNKIVVMVKEGTIDEDNAGDDYFITYYVAHNMDWVSHFIRSFATQCGAMVAIYAVDNSGNVVRLFKEWTSEEYKFRVFKEKRYELFEGMWDEVGWNPVAVD